MRALLVALVLLAACDRKAADKVGIGRYNVNTTTLAKVPGRCDPTDLPDGRKGAWCYGQPKIGVAGMNADVDLYFGSNEPTAKVIEIQLQISGCDDAKLLGWLKKSFGPPGDDRGTKVLWTLPAIYVIGELGARCMVRVLPRSEQAEYERLSKP